ncbi:MAG: serine/threonine protein kinase [Desulfobacteraceae bacterium IS3]|nr:MAG: serine/threonine protein kinase [Desulfobacteraceae bacterium IS3]
MNQLLKLKQQVQLEASTLACEIEQFLGSGGQGEVYQSNMGGKPVALKWYFPQQASPEQKAALEMLIRKGAPNEKFLWPICLTSSQEVKGFGYIMPLRESCYKSIVDLMKRRIEPSFHALAMAGIELAHSFLQLHAKGLCYRDISFGNVFFNPDTGEIRICDNDNVAIDGEASAGILGTPRFMAPEVVRGEAKPSTQTDLFSLAILLFYMLMIHHPLEGKRETEIKCFDLPAMNKLYGTEPIFIFDPNNDANRPLLGCHDNAILYWQIYPQFLRETFIKSFTDGIRDPQNGRVRESEWRAVMARLRDSILYCGNCGAENFYDIDLLKQKNRLNPCWSCQKIIQIPPRLRIEKHVIMLNYNSQLFPHHIDPQKLYDFSKPIAAVNQHPKDPNIWGLKNLSDEKWVITLADGSVKDVEPGQNLTLAKGTEIAFGKIKGEIRL